MDAQFLIMLGSARDGLSHSIPGASMEQVLKAALELLIEKQARARGLVKRPRTVVANAKPIVAAAPAPTTTVTPGAASAAATAQEQAPAPSAASVVAPAPVRATDAATEMAVAVADVATETPPPSFTPPHHRRPGPRQAIPAAVRRAVWQRDGGRCSWPLDGGGVCGSSHRLELDHLVPWARWGGETVDDLRVVCHAHNALAAREAFGHRFAGRYAGARPGA